MFVEALTRPHMQVKTGAFDEGESFHTHTHRHTQLPTDSGSWHLTLLVQPSLRKDLIALRVCYDPQPADVQARHIAWRTRGKERPIIQGRPRWPPGNCRLSRTTASRCALAASPRATVRRGTPHARATPCSWSSSAPMEWPSLGVSGDSPRSTVQYFDRRAPMLGTKFGQADCWPSGWLLKAPSFCRLSSWEGGRFGQPRAHPAD